MKKNETTPIKVDMFSGCVQFCDGVRVFTFRTPKKKTCRGSSVVVFFRGGSEFRKSILGTRKFPQNLTNTIYPSTFDDMEVMEVGIGSGRFDHGMFFFGKGFL